MKKTWLLHLIFTLLVLPIYLGAQYLSAFVGETTNNAWLVLFCLLGIPLLYFIAWFVLTILIFKKKTKERALESK